MKRYIRVNGVRRAVWFDGEGWFAFAGHDSRRPIARDQHDYRYTHGGDAYRAACELAWRLGLMTAWE